ncbi:MAG: HD domain-containing protein [Theionarchaea archaeon]|nr:HD domain-containing protein [Theionarchaea archaeon]MBU7000926.1 HD domain-containing protein [Theionarchaea archaeon]MBU7021132.1 HD domain-containing protein [Theionarchaea archaeon]MBU7033859.1 HD domain-containing protein [Theionarchaea archaeon]
MDYKVIHDSLHGSIKLEGVFLELMDAPELQRLHYIRQLGMAYLVFPGANHTRFSHSLGTYFIASKIASELQVSEIDQTVVAIAAFLHDIGHGPFSHTLEYAFHSLHKINHTDQTSRIITGEVDVIPQLSQPSRRTIPHILEDYDVSPKEVGELIQGMKVPYEWTLTPWLEDNPQKVSPLTQIIHGEIDADQLDYLLRDSYYTGVAYGVIDLPYLLHTLELHNTTLSINPKGIEAAEALLVARSLMFSSVYYHHAVRIAETMLTRAAEDTLEKHPEIMKMSDGDFLAYLERGTPYQKEMVTRLRYRNLFKRVWVVSAEEPEYPLQDVIEELSNPESRKEKEDILCRKAGIPPGFSLIDIPERDISLSEPRMARPSILVYDGEFKRLSEYTPTAAALQRRKVPSWGLMVSSPPEYVEKVRRVCEKVIFR